jgi:uncharacterized protein YydD (DUF2326 family)
MLSFLSGTDIFGKYKLVSDEMVTLRADITSLERQRGFLHRLQELRTEIRALTEERGHLQTQIEADVEKQNSDQNTCSRRSACSLAIVEDVIDRKALLSVSPNEAGHLEFKVRSDESGNATSAISIHLCKLLCTPSRWFCCARTWTTNILASSTMTACSSPWMIVRRKTY